MVVRMLCAGRRPAHRPMLQGISAHHVRAVSWRDALRLKCTGQHGVCCLLQDDRRAMGSWAAQCTKALTRGACRAAEKGRSASGAPRRRSPWPSITRLHTMSWYKTTTSFVTTMPERATNRSPGRGDRQRQWYLICNKPSAGPQPEGRRGRREHAQHFEIPLRER